MIKTDITLKIKYTENDVREAISLSLGFPSSEIKESVIVRRALNLSDTAAPTYRATVAFRVGDERRQGLLKMRKRVSEYPDYTLSVPRFSGDFRPVVVGSGPCGLFAALTLAESGARPVLLERGLPVEERSKRVELFNKLGVLDPECNVQFGEGGAGTYSDGKLKVGSMDKYKMKVLSEFISSGADSDIAFSSTAHLGTDRLPLIVAEIRRKIVSLGGEIIFGARFTDFALRDFRLYSVEYERNGERVTLPTRAVILATGHSARDTLYMLYNKGVNMSSRGFGVGMRIEHSREYINGIVYKDAREQIDETASYHLVTHLKSGRSVYSFCMCPGGTVVAASGEKGCTVTNGMSEHARMGDNSNSALLVSVTPEDFGSAHALAGIEYQRAIERRAFSLTSDYVAPATTLSAFLSKEKPKALGSIKPSYPRGVELIAPEYYLPEYISDSVRAAIPDFDSWLSGYSCADAVLTGPETRTTSPVCIHRSSDTMECDGFTGIYPAGEGAGYAGGIVSSARDGIRVAERLILKYTSE